MDDSSKQNLTIGAMAAGGVGLGVATGKDTSESAVYGLMAGGGTWLYFNANLNNLAEAIEAVVKKTGQLMLDLAKDGVYAGSRAVGDFVGDELVGDIRIRGIGGGT